MAWDLVSLGECCEIVSGSTPKRDEPDHWGGDIAWVTPKDISSLRGTILSDTPEHITESGYRSCSTKLLPKGAILFSSRAPIGLVAIAGREMCTNQGFKSLVPGDGVDSLFLYYCMKWIAPRVAALGTGATFKEVNKQVVSEFMIPLPPLPEQKRIAAFLDKADSIRRRRQDAITLADTFLRSVFLKMFGDPVTNPVGWDEALLKDVASIGSGVTKGKTYKGSELVEVPYMRVANVQDGWIDISDIKTISVSHADVERYAMEKGDLLLTEGGDPDKLGRGAVWDGSISPCIHQNHIFKVRFDTSIILPEFASFLIGSARGKRYFLRAAKQTTGIATINKTQLSNFSMLVPDMKQQDTFVKAAKAVKSAKQKLDQVSEESNNLFFSLQQRAFRGDL